MVEALAQARKLKSTNLLSILNIRAIRPKSRHMHRPTAANIAVGRRLGGTANKLKNSRMSILWSADAAKRDATGLGWNTITSILDVATCMRGVLQC